MNLVINGAEAINSQGGSVRHPGANRVHSAEKVYMVSVHLNHANSGEWELWTDEKYRKTGAWPVGGVGGSAVEALLEGLYVRALSDPLLIPFLENIDIERLKVYQFAFISQAIGGPHRYTGPSLLQAHARLRIEQRHFDAFVAHLRHALQELGAIEDTSAEIMSRVEPLSSLIVNTPSGAKAAT